jgi:hypothetical protein
MAITKFVTIEIPDQFSRAESGGLLSTEAVTVLGNTATIIISLDDYPNISPLEDYSYIQFFGVSENGTEEDPVLARDSGPKWIQRFEEIDTNKFEVEVYVENPNNASGSYIPTINSNFPAITLMHTSLIVPDYFTDTRTQKVTGIEGGITIADGFKAGVQRIVINNIGIGYNISLIEQSFSSLPFNSSSFSNIFYVSAIDFPGFYVGNEYVYVINSTGSTAPVEGPYPAVTNSLQLEILRAVGNTFVDEHPYGSLVRENPGLTSARLVAYVNTTDTILDSGNYRQCRIIQREKFFAGRIDAINSENTLASTGIQAVADSIDLRTKLAVKSPPTVTATNIIGTFLANNIQIQVKQRSLNKTLKWVMVDDIAHRIYPEIPEFDPNPALILPDLALNSDGSVSAQYVMNYYDFDLALPKQKEYSEKDVLLLKSKEFDDFVYYSFATENAIRSNRIYPYLNDFDNLPDDVPGFGAGSGLARARQLANTEGDNQNIFAFNYRTINPISGARFNRYFKNIEFYRSRFGNQSSTQALPIPIHVFETTRESFGDPLEGQTITRVPFQRYTKITPAEVALQIIISTGSSVGWKTNLVANPGNHGQYDVLPEGFGLGISPLSIDLESFERVIAIQEANEVFFENIFISTKDVSKLSEFMDKNILKPFGMFLSTARDGRFVLRRPNFGDFDRDTLDQNIEVIDEERILTKIDQVPDIIISQKNSDSYHKYSFTSTPAWAYKKTVEYNKLVPYIDSISRQFIDPEINKRYGFGELKYTFDGYSACSSYPIISDGLGGAVAPPFDAYFAEYVPFLGAVVTVDCTIEADLNLNIGDLIGFNVFPQSISTNNKNYNFQNYTLIYGVITSILYSIIDNSYKLEIIGINFNILRTAKRFAPTLRINDVTSNTVFEIDTTYATKANNFSLIDPPQGTFDIDTVREGWEVILYSENWERLSFNTVALDTLNIGTNTVTIDTAFRDGSSNIINLQVNQKVVLELFTDSDLPQERFYLYFPRSFRTG